MTPATSEGERSAADRQDWEEPLEADRPDNLKPGQNDPRISERRQWRRLQSCARLRIPSAAGDMNRVCPEQRHGRQEEHAGPRETGVDKAVSVQRDDKSCGAKETQRHRRCDDRRCGDRAEPQSVAGVLLPAIGDPFERDNLRQTTGAK